MSAWAVCRANKEAQMNEPFINRRIRAFSLTTKTHIDIKTKTKLGQFLKALLGNKGLI